MNFFYLAFFLFILQFKSFAFESAGFFESLFPTENPHWMVEITTEMAGNKKIRGTGYIVKINNNYFVRSTSHITLGKRPFSMKSGANEIIEIYNKDDFITDNNIDDILIHIKNPSSPALGIFSHKEKQFLINSDLYNSHEIYYALRKKSISSEHTRLFYIVPNWSKGPYGKYKNLGPTLPTGNMSSRLIGNNSGFIESSDGLSFFSEVKTFPGESGSPLLSKLLIMNQL